MLEHLCSIVGPWIDLLEENLPHYLFVLIMGDITTAAGWLEKSNFKYSNDESTAMTEAKLKLAGDHAPRLMENKCCDYSQRFQGGKNDLVNSLSREHHLPTNVLTHLFKTSIPSQTPKILTISPLLQEIHCYITSLLQSLHTQQQERLKTSKIAHGAAGMNSSQIWDWDKILSSKKSTNDNKPSSSLPLDRQSENANFLKNLEILSKLPWTTYHRPSETLTGLTRGMTEVALLAEFYKNSSRATKTKIQNQSKRKCSH